MKSRPNCETYASSQLRKATPFWGSASTSSNLARAIPAWPSIKFSMCAVPTLVTTPQSGEAMRVSTGDLSGVVHAHFDHGILMLRLEAHS